MKLAVSDHLGLEAGDGLAGPAVVQVRIAADAFLHGSLVGNAQGTVRTTFPCLPPQEQQGGECQEDQDDHRQFQEGDSRTSPPPVMAAAAAGCKGQHFHNGRLGEASYWASECRENQHTSGICPVLVINVRFGVGNYERSLIAKVGPAGDKGPVRIIAGSAGRMRIRVPAEVARPTTDFVRQAVFSILSEVVEEARVLDLFAGSGALGLEALSRGAKSCRFVDDNRKATAVIEDNLKRTGLAGGTVVRSDVGRFLRQERGTYDLVFSDPPYVRSALDHDHVAEMIGGEDLRRVVEPGGWLVVEMAAEATTREGDGWELKTRRSYGGASILLYGRGASP